MAFKEKNFSPVGAFSGTQNTGFGVFTYESFDTSAAIRADGYFNDLRDNLGVNDLIFVSCEFGQRPVDRMFFVGSVLTVPPSPSIDNVTLKTNVLVAS